MFLRWIHKIETSSLCNRNCAYCPQDNLGYEKGNMSMETFDRVLEWVKLLNPSGQPTKETFLHLQGFGEPLLNPDIAEMVDKINKITPAGLSTNGDFLDDDMAKDLKEANIGFLCISQHDDQVTKRAIKIARENLIHNVVVQNSFDDNWAKQVDMPRKSPFYHCTHLETGGAMILWNGDIVTCCVDAQANPVLGNVYDDEIRHIDIKPIPLCEHCRNIMWQKDIIRMFSDTLTYDEKLAFFSKWLQRGLL